MTYPPRTSQVNPADTPVFVAEALFMAEDARNALAHALFTRLGAPALTMTPQAVSAPSPSP